MSSALLDMSLSNFIEVLSGDKPTPGGGSVAALNGALACALTEMVCRLALAKPKKLESGAFEKLTALLSEISQMRKEFENAIDRDAAAFDSVMAVYREKDLELTQKQTRLFAAYLEAARLPLRMAKLAGRCEELACEVLELTPSSTRSDIESAIANAKAAYSCALANVRINLAELERLLNSPEQEKVLQELWTELKVLRSIAT